MGCFILPDQDTEMIIIVDVDLDLLMELHEFGSVRILKDRRHDLYRIKKAPASQKPAKKTNTQWYKWFLNVTCGFKKTQVKRNGLA